MTSCQKVWDEILRIKDKEIETNSLEDAFTDFECSWEEHARKYHGGGEIEWTRMKEGDEVDVIIPIKMKVELMESGGTQGSNYRDYRIQIADEAIYVRHSPEYSLNEVPLELIRPDEDITGVEALAIRTLQKFIETEP